MTNNIIIMKNLIVDATRDKIFLTLIVSENIYTCSHENSKINFEKLMILNRVTKREKILYFGAMIGVLLVLGFAIKRYS